MYPVDFMNYTYIALSWRGLASQLHPPIPCCAFYITYHTTMSHLALIIVVMTWMPHLGLQANMKAPATLYPIYP